MKMPPVREYASSLLGIGGVCVTHAIPGGGVGHVSATFEFFAKFLIGLHRVLPIPHFASGPPSAIQIIVLCLPIHSKKLLPQTR